MGAGMAIVGILVSLLSLIFWGAIIWWIVTRFTGNKKGRKLTARAQRRANAASTGGEINMKDTMLDQMNDDLEQSVQTDKTVVAVGMFANLALLISNTSVAAAAHDPKAGTAIKLIFWVLTAFAIVLNLSVGYALLAGKARRVRIKERLEKFWQDEEMGKHQDSSISRGYETRGNLFTIIFVALGVVVLLVSLIAYFIGF